MPSRHRIVTAPAKGVASEHAPDWKIQSFKRPVFIQRFYSIFWTRRNKSAWTPCVWRYGSLIKPYYSQKHLFHKRVSQSPAFWISLIVDETKSLYSASLAASLGTKTNRLFFDTLSNIEKKASFIRRLSLLRSTLLPNFFDTENPTFKCGVFVLTYISIRFLSETDFPFLYTYLNSLLRLSEYSRLNILSIQYGQINGSSTC